MLFEPRFKIYTAQMNVGKKLKHSLNVKFIDITALSGTCKFAEFFKPDWDMVNKVKQDGDWESFKEAYYKLLDSRDSSWVISYLTLLASNRTSYEAIVFACYCGSPDTCHRKLAAEWCVERVNIANGGEIKAKQISLESRPIKNTVLINVTEDVFERVRNTKYINPWMARGVLIIPQESISESLDAACSIPTFMGLLASGEEDSISGVKEASFVIVTIDNDIDRKTYQMDEDVDAIGSILQTLTVYEERNVCTNIFEFETVINSRCLLQLHVIK